jgi:hypothetical protein
MCKGKYIDRARLNRIILDCLLMEKGKTVFRCSFAIGLRRSAYCVLDKALNDRFSQSAVPELTLPTAACVCPNLAGRREEGRMGKRRGENAGEPAFFCKKGAPRAAIMHKRASWYIEDSQYQGALWLHAEWPAPSGNPAKTWD